MLFNKKSLSCLSNYPSYFTRQLCNLASFQFCNLLCSFVAVGCPLEIQQRTHSTGLNFVTSFACSCSTSSLVFTSLRNIVSCHLLPYPWCIMWLIAQVDSDYLLHLVIMESVTELHFFMRISQMYSQFQKLLCIYIIMGTFGPLQRAKMLALISWWSICINLSITVDKYGTAITSVEDSCRLFLFFVVVLFQFLHFLFVKKQCSPQGPTKCQHNGKFVIYSALHSYCPPL